MRKLITFDFITLNGFFKGENEEIGWHRHEGEEVRFSEESLEDDHILLFGRKTYEMMVAFWHTPVAKESMPKVAEGMNKAEKIVFSTTLKKADWNNTRVLKKNIAEEIRRMKQSPGKNMTVPVRFR